MSTAPEPLPTEPNPTGATPRDATPTDRTGTTGPTSPTGPDGSAADPPPDARPLPDDAAAPEPEAAEPTARPPLPPAAAVTPIAAVTMSPRATMRASSPPAPTRAEMAGRPAQITVVPWGDDLLDRFGHDPRSPYVERFWLGVLGPSGTWLLRSFAHRFDAEPEGFTIDLKDTARTLGIGSRGGPNGALYRTLERVMAFGFARFLDEQTLAVRLRMAPLNRRQLQRLPRERQREHDAWLAAQAASPTPSVDDVRRRARALALSLLELGEDLAATEQQLHRWRFHPAIAYDSVRWAAVVHRHRIEAATGAPDEPVPEDRAPGGDAA